MKVSRAALCLVLMTQMFAAKRANAADTGEPELAFASGPTEQSVFDLWLHSSREVASWRSAVGAARFDLVAARTFPNPSLQLGGGYTVSGTPTSGLYSWGPQVTFALPVLGQLGGRKDAAFAALRLAEVNVLLNLWNRAADIQQAMRDRAFANARVDTARSNLGELARIEQVVSVRVASGANSQYDSLRVSVTAGTLKAALANALIDRDRAETHLVSLVNAEGVTSLPVTRSGLIAFRGPESMDALITQALSRRPDLELARRGIRLAELNASRYRKESIPIPSVYVGGFFTYDPLSANSQGPAALSSTSIQGGVSFPLPLFDRNQGQVGRAVTEAEGQSVLALGIAERVRTEVKGAWQARGDAKRALDDFTGGSLLSVKTLIERAEVSYRAGGSFMIMDLLDAHRAGWEAHQQELDLQRTFVDAECDLEHAAALVGLVPSS